MIKRVTKIIKLLIFTDKSTDYFRDDFGRSGNGNLSLYVAYHLGNP